MAKSRRTEAKMQNHSITATCEYQTHVMEPTTATHRVERDQILTNMSFRTLAKQQAVIGTL